MIDLDPERKMSAMKAACSRDFLLQYGHLALEPIDPVQGVLHRA
jgi:hypothetical protein